MNILGSAGYAGDFNGVSNSAHRRMQESRIALHRVMEATGHSIDDVVNDPIAKFRVRHFYKVNRWVDHYLKAREREALAREESQRWIIRL